ncbi:MAG: cold-shock protein [Alphaproteobacteria bacterium]|nr:cold-shock protein [Alphaproteobacteria bacterium]
MATGTVKWFDTNLGYGFIAPRDGSPDVFVHFTALDLAGLRTLAAGAAVRFEQSQDSGVTRAVNLELGGNP